MHSALPAVNVQPRTDTPHAARAHLRQGRFSSLTNTVRHQLFDGEHVELGEVLRGRKVFDELEVGGEEGGVEGVQRGDHTQERVVSETLAEVGKTGGGGGGARATDGAVNAFAGNARPAADAEAGAQRHKQLRKRGLRRE
jgi:hypothetical protein